MRIADVLHHRDRVVHKIRTTDTVTKAVRKLSEHQIGALLVTDSWGRHVGIVSERDLIHGLERFGETTPELPVGELMSQDLITCQMKDRVHKALEMMTTHRIRHLPVKESGAIVGIVSIGDLVGALIGTKELEVAVLRDMARTH
jgi:signal-transduction protein with cAMP-binding, CBS, and nucleotidyltransferase domain